MLMKNEKLKLFGIGILFCLLFSLIGFGCTKYEYEKYKKSVNSFLYETISIIKEKYPNITENEIMALLNQKKAADTIESFEKYGINANSSLLLSLENEYKRNQILIFSFACLLSFTFYILFYLYFHKKDKNLQELTYYLEEINNRNYKLDIELNGEDSLSLLRNEIYKTTIMLREESEQLKKDKELLKDSIAEISHQLKTPLTSILIMLDNILENPHMKEETKEDFIHNAHKQVENMNFLIAALLKIARFDADVILFKKEDIEVSKLISKVLENLSVLIEEKEIEMVVKCPKQAKIRGDFHWQVEAFSNLIKNAIEYSKKKDSILIEVLDNSLYTKIKIEDHGKGIPKKDIENLFKRFYKGENSATNSSGIGLYLAKKIIEKENGFIFVQSELKKGTLITIKYLKTIEK